MPTGYTAAVVDGEITELKDFAMSCARAFVALIHMRDEPSDADIPETIQPHLDYYVPALEKAEKALAEHMALPYSKYAEVLEKEYQEELKRFNEYETAKAERNFRIMTMLEKVRAWDTDAEGIKDFMIQQLEISIEDYEADEPVKKSEAIWAMDKLDRLQWDVNYLRKQIKEEIERTADRNRWLKALRKSLETTEYEIVGTTYDGVNILKPAVESKNFTREEVKEAVEKAKGPNLSKPSKI